MFDIENTLAEYGLTPERYEELLKNCSDKVHKVSDMDWSEIADKYGIKWNGDSLRKAQQPPLLGGAFVREYYQWKNEKEIHNNDDNYSNELMLMKRELERAKIQFRDERNAWQKQNYIDARVENKLNLLEEKFLEMGKVNFPAFENVQVKGGTDLLVILSDLHIGQTFSSIWGEYNSSIASNRLTQLLEEVIKIGKRHNSEKVYVSIQGDLISGSIHKTLAITNRENVIEQIKLAAEMITSFCYELSKHFNYVFISNVSGNHSRIDKKDEALHDERLDDLIGWIVENSLKHIDNITMLHRNIDNGIADLSIRGKSYVAVHGDFDAYNKAGVSNLCMLLGFIPYAITYGHLHVCALDETNGVKMIRGGSLAGSGDSYTIEKRLSGKPSQMVCVCSEKGVDAYYTVELY